MEGTDLEALENAFERIVAEETAIKDGKKFEEEKFDAAKQKEVKEKEEKAAAKDDWRPEDIDNLTKAITKFPPGTVQRWKVITDFVGNKSQKEVIKKSKDLAQKRQDDMIAA